MIRRLLGRDRIELSFFKKWNRVLDWKLPFAKWFVGRRRTPRTTASTADQAGPGQPHGDPLEGELVDAKGNPTEVRKLSYNDLLKEVCRFANGLKKLG